MLHSTMAAEDRRADAGLIAQTLRGDPVAAEHFVERMRCVPRMLRARNSSFGQPIPVGEIDDLAQEVLALLWRDRGRFDGTAKLETWAHGYCTRVLFSAARARVRQARRRDRSRSCEDAPAAATRAEDPSEIQRCLGRLPPEERQIVELRHFEELSFEQAAARLGISANTCKTRYYRALCRLRSRLERRY